MNSRPPSVPRSCMRQEIRDALLRQILEGELKPGDRLVEMRLAQDFRTSQAPVREALRELEALGYLTTEPYRGTRVRQISAHEMRDAFRLRALLEREAAEAAAAAPDTDFRQLRAAVEGIEAAAASGDIAGYVRHDERFHRALVTGSRNLVLLKHWNLLLVPTRILVVMRSGIVDMRETAEQHRPILDALERRDGTLAGRLVYDHVNRIAARLKEAGKTGSLGDA